MNARNTLHRLLPLSLTLGLLVPACDGGAAKKDAKPEQAEPKPAADAAKADADDEEEEEEEKDAEEEAPEAADAEEEAPEAADAEEETPEEETPEEATPDEEEDEEEDEDEAEDSEEKVPAKTTAKPKANKPKPKPKADDAKPAADEAKTASSADGKKIYLKKCKACHGVTGAADTKLAQKHDIESWKEPGWKGKWSLSKVKDIVNNGKSGTKMKAFKSKLTPEEIDAVSVYARSLGK